MKNVCIFSYPNEKLIENEQNICSKNHDYAHIPNIDTSQMSSGVNKQWHPCHHINETPPFNNN